MAIRGFPVLFLLAALGAQPIPTNQISPSNTQWIKGGVTLTGTIVDSFTNLTSLFLYTNGALYTTNAIITNGGGLFTWSNSLSTSNTLINGSNQLTLSITNATNAGTNFSYTLLADNLPPLITNVFISNIGLTNAAVWFFWPGCPFRYKSIFNHQLF